MENLTFGSGERQGGMREKTDLFLIDGQPMLAPDENLQMTAEDVSSVDSARDESGFFHRFVVRQGVGKWKFTYAHLTGEEYAYMEGLFQGKQTFQLTYPDPATGETKVISAYRGSHTVLWQSAANDRFRDYTFTLVAC